MDSLSLSEARKLALGAQGFGKEFTRRLLQENCCICISDIDIETGTKTVSEFQKEY